MLILPLVRQIDLCGSIRVVVGSAHPTLNNIVGLIYQVSTLHYQLSTIHYPLSTIHYPLSTIHYQLSTAI